MQYLGVVIFILPCPCLLIVSYWVIEHYWTDTFEVHECIIVCSATMGPVWTIGLQHLTVQSTIQGTSVTDRARRLALTRTWTAFPAKIGESESASCDVAGLQQPITSTDPLRPPAIGWSPSYTLLFSINLAITLGINNRWTSRIRPQIGHHPLCLSWQLSVREAQPHHEKFVFWGNDVSTRAN